ncbi:hypothetical protein BGI41_03995 [Methanobrevibacter sp. 87.7]|uniref:hydrogenase subunit MbhD domain-containing protein n=1 Tax=Methanobrevibacter sp. 87.7 TaxID=387957 RepID=UPI000B5071CB|nr:hydrogenase subunit MbhD domain-containing protein [Methanobrevibacter sp. 87.7]OWT33139.1 hypothetical protein BGI41_03995 [Methanobrevibacter sp. 87.7]
MIEVILVIIVTLIASILTLLQEDLLKVAILSGISAVGIAVLFQILLAPDVALTQAIVGGAITPVFIALAIKKTQRMEGE